MDAHSRRTAILSRLEAARQPVSAAALAAEFSVSRQSIVGDIALLRAGGAAVSATPRGYILDRGAPGLRRTLACVHSAADMAAELYAMVDNGCTVLDVVVSHPVYGQLTGQLQLSSRYDVDHFVARIGEEQAPPLSALTGGVHLHTLLCPDEAAFRRVRDALSGLGFLYPQAGEVCESKNND